jgi:histone H3/H4
VPPPPPDYAELTIEEKLQTAVRRLVDIYGHRIILIVDELDRVRDTTGLASFIKIASSHDLMFLLVGIAQNVSNLLSDHQSIERMAVPIEVPRMNKHELGQIVERAMRKLREQGIVFKFEPDAKAELAKVASGFPWFVHLLGQTALLKAEEEGRNTVTRFHVKIAVRSLIDNRLAQQFSDLYQAAVRDSRMREAVLRALTLWYGRDIPTAEVYPVVRRLGVSHPSTYISHLCNETYGRVLLRPPFQDRGIVRFANEMFKVYIRIRPSLYDGLDDLVKEAYASEGGKR